MYNEKSPPNRAHTRIEIIFRDTATFLKSCLLMVEKGGIYIKTDTPLPLDTQVLIKMTLPGESKPIEAEGKVVLTTHKADKSYFAKGMGIKFENISPEDYDKIMGIIKQDKAKSHDLAIF